MQGLNVGGPVQFQPVVPPEAETPCGVDDVTILPNQTTKYKDDVSYL